MRQLRLLMAIFGLAVAVLAATAQQPDKGKSDFKAPPPTPTQPPPAGKAPPPATKSAPPSASPAPPAVPHLGAPATPPCHPWDGKTIVMVANDVGGSTTFSNNLANAASGGHCGLVILTKNWCRKPSAKADYHDRQGQDRAASRIAERVQCLHGECPHSRFVLVGFGAGSRVVVAAAEQLPPGSLDRIVLLGSSLSFRYDLQPALLATCGGIDSFFSKEDGALQEWEMDGGTVDGQRGPTGGRIGFRNPYAPDCGYPNVRQYRWKAEYGGTGGHYYWATEYFQKRTLATLLSTAAITPVAVAPVAPHDPPPAAPTPKAPPAAPSAPAKK
jgi:hypothetical protein